MKNKFLVGLALWGTLLLAACGGSSSDTLTLSTAAPATVANTTDSAAPADTTSASGVSRATATRPANRPAQRASMNYSAPEFSLSNLQEQTVNLADYQGQPMIVNFWATWCGPCKQELPLLNRTYNGGKSNIVVLGVDQGEEIALVKLKVREVGMTYPNVLDKDLKVGSAYRVTGLPTSYFLDKDGVIRDIQVGALDESTLKKGLAKIQP